MATYDVNTLAGQIYPIVGAGIGLGLLAGTSRMVMDTMYGNRYQTRRPLSYPSQRYRNMIYEPRRPNRQYTVPYRRMRRMSIPVRRSYRWRY